MLNNTRLAQIIAGLTILLLLATVVWPLKDEKDKAADATISADISTLSYAIERYHSSENELPTALEDVDVEDEVFERAKKHNYKLDVDSSTSYELCATFKTDTTGSAGDDVYATMSSYMPSENPYNHTKGENCFEYKVYADYYNYDSGSGDDIDFDSWFNGSGGTQEAESSTLQYEL